MRRTRRSRVPWRRESRVGGSSWVDILPEYWTPLVECQLTALERVRLIAVDARRGQTLRCALTRPDPDQALNASSRLRANADVGGELDATRAERRDDAAVHEQVAAGDEARLRTHEERRRRRDFVRRAHSLGGRRLDERPIHRPN